eukprot:SAG31_NODE_14586_length_798_cov_0.489270_1_plen_223_part_10
MINALPLPLAFPYLKGDAAKGYNMNLPRDFLDMVIADAHNLRHRVEGGSYIDNKGTTWWQPKTEPRRFSLEQMIEIVGKIDFPDGMPKSIVGAEYWVQERRGDEDSGFHYDKDESAASNKQRMVFPALSTITYLTDGGAPTMVLNQTTNQFGNVEVPAVPTEGWLSFPARGKVGAHSEMQLPLCVAPLIRRVSMFLPCSICGSKGLPNTGFQARCASTDVLIH